MMNINQKKTTDYPLIYLQNFVYPTLNEALSKLVEHVLTTNEINDHQERLKQQRIRNKAEQRKHNKERLREELGSEYESSDEDDSSFDLDFNPDERGVIQGGEEVLSDDASQTIQELAINTSEQKQQTQQPNTQEKEEIAEKDLNPIDEEEPSQEKESIIYMPLKFNPVQYLAAMLKELNQQKKAEAK